VALRFHSRRRRQLRHEEGAKYVAALRDWVRNGDRSIYALSDEEFARRVKPRSAAEMEADAGFKLAAYFHDNGNQELAEKYFEQAQQLKPDDWNYHRHEWSFTPKEAGKKWMRRSRSSISRNIRSSICRIRLRSSDWDISRILSPRPSVG
jgi:hypothetical protein